MNWIGSCFQTYQSRRRFDRRPYPCSPRHCPDCCRWKPAYFAVTKTAAAVAERSMSGRASTLAVASTRALRAQTRPCDPPFDMLNNLV